MSASESNADIVKLSTPSMLISPWHVSLPVNAHARSSATAMATAAMNASVSILDMRHMVRLVDGLPRPICFTRAVGRQRSGQQPRPSKTTVLDFWVPWGMS
jgi:hypothetical protein